MESLAILDHRDRQPPDGPWLMGQSWTDLLFAHWPVSFDRLRELVPRPLEIQQCDGTPWIGVTPFRIEALRLYRLPPAPWASRFPEVNVRTYVEHDGMAGIYFLSLDADSLGAVLAARTAYRLPYHYSSASLSNENEGWRVWQSDRRTGTASLKVSYRPLGARFSAPEDPFAKWAAERYRLFNVNRNGVVREAEIHHRPWMLREAEARFEANSMTTPFRIELTGRPRLHFADPQDVLIWRLSGTKSAGPH